MWCVSVQALPLHRIQYSTNNTGDGSSGCSALISAIAYALDSPFGSSTIEHEALTSMSRLVVQVRNIEYNNLC